MIKVKVLTDYDMWGCEEEKDIVMGKEELETLSHTLDGFGKSILEYETTDKKIISDDMISRIVSQEEVV